MTLLVLKPNGPMFSMLNPGLFFQYICRQFEMVLSDGSRIVCSPTEKPELFAAVPFSYGTLGFLVSVDIDIIPYKPYIK